MTIWRVAPTLALLSLGFSAFPAEPPFAPGEVATFRITYLHILAGRASLRVESRPGGGLLRFVEEAKSQGFFAWLFRYKVDDLTIADWDKALGCSLGIEKHLREGRARRDQRVLFDPQAHVATVQDSKIAQTRFDVAEGALDVLSAFYVTRMRGVPEEGRLSLPVFDNGKAYVLGVRYEGRESLDLPEPLGHISTVIVEPQLVEGTGLFVKKGRLLLWLTDDARRIPVRLRSRVAVGSISADLESYDEGRR